MMGWFIIGSAESDKFCWQHVDGDRGMLRYEHAREQVERINDAIDKAKEIDQLRAQLNFETGVAKHHMAENEWLVAENERLQAQNKHLSTELARLERKADSLEAALRVIQRQTVVNNPGDNYKSFMRRLRLINEAAAAALGQAGEE